MSSTRFNPLNPEDDESDITYFTSLRSPEDNNLPSSTHRRGTKGKEREDESTEHVEPSNSDDSNEHLTGVAYPPISEEAEETRRVEENLKKWEIAERQRRKAARTSSVPDAFSVVTDVSRRTSLLWPNGRAQHHSLTRSHTGLHSSDGEILPFQRPATSSIFSSKHIYSNDTQEEHLQDPFNHPIEDLSPFSDSYQTDPHLPVTPSKLRGEALSDSGAQHPPLPRPLNLPPPKTPPPFEALPLGRSLHNQLEEDPESKSVRWWHEWLCGCSEGPDRGGDHQAGRTNPFE